MSPALLFGTTRDPEEGGIGGNRQPAARCQRRTHLPGFGAIWEDCELIQLFGFKIHGHERVFVEHRPPPHVAGGLDALAPREMVEGVPVDPVRLRDLGIVFSSRGFSPLMSWRNWLALIRLT